MSIHNSQPDNGTSVSAPSYNLEPVFAEIERLLPITTNALIRVSIIRGRQFLRDWMRRYPPELPISNVPQRDLYGFAKMLESLWNCGVKLDGMPPPPDPSTLFLGGIICWEEPSEPSTN